MAKMADREHGGYFEIMERNWRPVSGARRGGDRKSFDVHMHMMEALTKVVEVTGEAVHRQLLSDVVEILCTRMLDPTTGTGIQQFDTTFTPLPPIVFERVGTADFYLSRARTAVFASNLVTNLDRDELRNNARSVGIQVDFRFTVKSRFDMTLSAGYARGNGEGSFTDEEWMLSLKIM